MCSLMWAGAVVEHFFVGELAGAMEGKPGGKGLVKEYLLEGNFSCRNGECACLAVTVFVDEWLLGSMWKVGCVCAFDCGALLRANEVVGKRC